MKIYSLANSITFGYNKGLNNQVNKKLETTEKDSKKSQSAREMARDLRNRNLDCMKLEDKLRRAEKFNNHAEIDFYKDIFISSKSAVTDKLNKRFPNMDYLTKELMEYQREVIDRQITNKNHWLVEIVDELTDMLAYNEFNKEEEISEKFNQKRAEGQSKTKSKTSINSEVPAKKPDDETNNLVQLFVPDEYSPAGFESIGAMDELKGELYDKIIYPIKNPEQAELDRIEYGKRFPRGIMFYGPSGCGKTYLMEAIAQEPEYLCINLKLQKSVQLL